MGYGEALGLAWSRLETIKKQDIYAVKFLSDEYTVDICNHTVQSLSCNTPAHTHVAISVLHYLIVFLKGFPELSGSWISFPELDGGKGYFPAFKKRALDPIVRKYGKNPEGLLDLIERFSAKKVQIGDIGIALEGFPGIPVLITFWKADDEFSAQANMLFDSSIKEIFPTEDVVVMAGFIASVI